MTRLKTILRLLLLLSFLLIACSPNEQPAGLTGNFEVQYHQNQALDSFALQIRQYYQLPALAIGKVDKRGKITTCLMGNNKARNGIPLPKNSKFQIASCTKSFTALLVAILISEGKLSWNTRVQDIFAEMKIHPYNREINVVELLSHTSGLRQFWTDEEVFEVDSIIPNLKGSVALQRQKFAAWNLKMPPASNKGEYQYSNAGYVVVAAMLEKITGQSYESLVKQHIIRPLALKSAEFGYSCLRDKNQAARHMNRDVDGVGIPLSAKERIPPALFNPCGFISLSIDDFTKYLSHCIRLQSGESGLLHENDAKMLFRNYTTTSDGNGVGLGWQLITINGTKTFGHTGSDQTMRVAMAINPKQKTGVVFVTNIGDSRSEQALVNVVHELINE
jgi:CubicO group peptidase (beta-lactamase class C family)